MTTPNHVPEVNPAMLHAFIASGIPVVLLYTGQGCTFCKVFQPIFDRVGASGDYRGRAVFARMDGNVHAQARVRHGVSSYPTALLLRGGSEVARVAGAQTEPALRAWIDAALRSQ